MEIYAESPVTEHFAKFGSKTVRMQDPQTEIRLTTVWLVQTMTEQSVHKVISDDELARTDIQTYVAVRALSGETRDKAILFLANDGAGEVDFHEDTSEADVEIQRLREYMGARFGLELNGDKAGFVDTVIDQFEEMVENQGELNKLLGQKIMAEAKEQVAESAKVTSVVNLHTGDGLTDEEWEAFADGAGIETALTELSAEQRRVGTIRRPGRQTEDVPAGPSVTAQEAAVERPKSHDHGDEIQHSDEEAAAIAAQVARSMGSEEGGRGRGGLKTAKVIDPDAGTEQAAPEGVGTVERLGSVYDK